MRIITVKTLARSLCSGLVVAVFALLAGCQSVSVTHTAESNGSTFPPTEPQTVEILHTEPNRPHVRLGEVQAAPSDDLVTDTKIKEAIQKEAAKLGANAAVVVYDHTQVTGAYVTGPWYGRAIERIEGRIVVIAVAIRYQ